MAHDIHVGRILEGENYRDAIHVAIAPVIAEHAVRPGQHVGFTGQDTTKVGYSRNPVGIIDPFLKNEVAPGEQCYLFLYPQTITSLRHEWTHPAFGCEPLTGDPVGDSKKWIEAFAARIDQTYGRLMEAAELFNEGGEYTYDNAEKYKDHWSEFDEFWEHYQVVTGKAVEDKSAFFTCSC